MHNSEKQYKEVLGERIRATREAQGLSQDQLAYMIGGTSNGANISRIELGKTGIQLETLHRIAKALGVTMCDLLEGF